jgi:2-polyprenyl-3-methyl-5-hydroxy-6-metoxy-1,4-benzoquinol methylase
MNLRYTLSFLRILKIPGLYLLMKDWQASIRINFIFAAYESGLLKALSQPCDRKALIKKLQIKRPELFDSLLEVGLAAKELAVKNGKFYIKGKRSKAVTDDNGDMLAAIIQASVTYYSDAYQNMTSRMHGEELGDNLNEIGEIVARFSKMTEPIIKDFLSSLVRGRNPMTVLDVGCGSGFLLRSVYEINSNANGIGLDIDKAVVEQAKNNINAWGLADQFKIHNGNISSFSEKAGPFDLISLINILYYFNEEDRYVFMNNLCRKLSPDGILIVVMNFHSKGKDIGAANLNVVNNSLKGLYPLPHVDEIKSLLEQCGLSKIKVHQFMPGSSFLGLVAYNS